MVKPSIDRALALQFFRYGIASAIALSADVGTLVLLKETLGVPVVLANTVSFTVGLMITFIFSRTWVFRERKIANPVVEFGVFAIVGVAGLLLNDAIVWAGTALGWYYLLAKALAAGVGFLWNFALRRWLIYR